MKKRTLTSLLIFLFFQMGFSQEILFQEEFAGSIPDTWTNNAISPANPELTWEWTVNGEAPTGAWWLGRPAILSPSIANGAAVFNSDFYQTGGEAANWGAGPIPGPHAVELISPIIDCSNGSDLILKFNQYYRPFIADAYVSVSGDAGATWTDIFVNDDVDVNIATNYFDVRFADISDVADGSPNVQIKFVFEGTAYVWIIDDVVIAERPAHQIDLPVTRRPPFYAVPKSQLGSYELGVGACNIWGNESQPDVTASMNWLDEAGELVYGAQAFAAGELPVDSCELLEFSDAYDASSLPVGTYTLASNVSSSNVNAFPSDFYLEEFVVSDSTFQKDNTYLTEGATGATSAPWEIGYDFPIVNGGYKVYGVDAAFSGNIDGQQVEVKIYEITNPDFATLNIDELVQVGYGFHELTADDGYVLKTFEMFNWPDLDPGVPLEAGKQYLVTGGTSSPNSIFLAMGFDIDYAASGWSSHMAIINGDLFTGGFGENRYAPVLRVHLRDETTGVSAREKEIGELVISPNPANVQASVKFKLFETAKELNIQLMDASGRLVFSQKMEEVKEQSILLETADLSEGTYFLELSSEKGRSTKSFLVNH